MTTSTGSRATLAALLVLTMAFAESCAAVEGIFKAGFWAGIVLAVVVIVGVFGLLSRLRS